MKKFKELKRGENATKNGNLHSFISIKIVNNSEDNTDIKTRYTINISNDKRIFEREKFHDGSDLNAADVVWTFRRLLNPEVGSGAGASILDFLTPEGIQVADARCRQCSKPCAVVADLAAGAAGAAEIKREAASKAAPATAPRTNSATTP